MSGDHIDQLMAVMEAAFDPHWGEAWNRRQVSDSLVLSSTHYDLIDSAGETAGPDASAAGFTLSRSAPGEEELLLIAVAPGHRGGGLGAALLHRLSDAAAQRGAERLFLEMRDNNPARGLYERHGFAPIGRRREYYRLKDNTLLDAITFAKDL